MELSEKDKEAIKQVGIGIAASAAMGAMMIIVDKVLDVITTSNWKEDDVTGNRQASPTEDTATLDSKTAQANANEASLAKDNVNGQGGDLNGSETEANANENGAVALNTDAKALKTAAGATEIATKALKFN